jgi:hypothetical protein
MSASSILWGVRDWGFPVFGGGRGDGVPRWRHGGGVGRGETRPGSSRGGEAGTPNFKKTGNRSYEAAEAELECCPLGRHGHPWPGAAK